MSMNENRFNNGIKIAIPQNILTAINGKRVQPFVAEWCEANDVTPSFLWEYYISKGLDYFEHPICPACKSILNMDSLPHKKDYRFCCNECRLSDIGKELAKQTRKDTLIKKYGVDNSAKIEGSTEKARETSIKRYGATSFTKTEEYKRKVEETSLKKYGTKSPNQSEVVKKRKEESCLSTYGKKNPFEVDSVKKKIVVTNLNRYGSNTPSKNAEVKQKIRETNQQRYGYDCFAFQDKAMRDNMFKKSLILHRTKYYETFVKAMNARHISLLSTKEEYINGESIELKCEVCGEVWKEERFNPNIIFCPKCDHSQSSLMEKDILQFVKNLGFECIANERKILDGKELDIYVPQKKLAIEFDGTYWHNSTLKDKRYHQNKTLECQKKGIRLIHIFEWEWETKRAKMENLIRSALGVFEKRIYARECEVKEIESETYKDFLETHHIQGSVNSPIRYGLFYGDELVSVIGFGKSRFKNGEIELHRYCVKAGYSIIGGFSKLIKHSGIKEFTSFVDLAHFDGEGYKRLGFEEVEITEPNYVYVKNGEVLSRIVCQKHKLQKLLGENFDSSLSETANMLMNGWNKLYDCGNLKVQFRK